MSSISEAELQNIDDSVDNGIDDDFNDVTIDADDEASKCDKKFCRNLEPGVDWLVRVWVVQVASREFDSNCPSRSQSPMNSFCTTTSSAQQLSFKKSSLKDKG